MFDKHLLEIMGYILTISFSSHVAAKEPGFMKHKLVFETPPMVWDEALPLGNGLLGALVWGDGKPLKISLDRTDLWDLRPVPEFHSEEYSYGLMRQWVKEGRIEDLHRVYDEPYRRAGPTKIPAGRIEIGLGESIAFEKSVLSIEDGRATVGFTGGPQAVVWIHASRPVGIIEIEGIERVTPKLVAPAFGGSPGGSEKPGISAGDLARLGYDPPQAATEENSVSFLQESWGGFRFAVALVWKAERGSWRGCWSVATSEESGNPLDLARSRARSALEEEPGAILSPHRRWWQDYWSQSSVEIPDEIVERQWYLETYKFGAAARRGHPPISLQGPWTADDGKLPPWKGDYHHDLNTQLCYWPCYSANHLEEGLGFLDWLWDTRGNCVEWTQHFFGLPGMNVPMTADLMNRQIGGWHQYTHSSTTACWLAHHFYMHWRYSMDRDFLRDRAYPYLRAVALFIEAVTEKDADGKRTLPLSSSPEINDNRLEAWFPSITNYDLALIRWLFQTCAEMAEELELDAEAQRWRVLLGEMPELSLAEEDRRLLVAKDIPLHESHRHLSHLMAIHPLGLVRWENGEEDQKTIRAALQEMDRLGTSKWTGYSFSWKALMAARARDGARAAEALDIFSTAFCLRSSFHCNGDQSGKGYSDFTYRPFTLEGNFAAAAAVQEMLLQSYSGRLRVFPAVPTGWSDASFETLRAEGAFLVSAERRDGKTQRVEILAEKGGTCRIKNPFGEAGFGTEGIDRAEVCVEGEDVVMEMSPGQKVALEKKGQTTN